MMGNFYKKRYDYPFALNYYYQSLPIATEVGQRPLLSEIYENLFEIYKETNKADSALKYHILFKEYSDQLNKEEVLKEISRLELLSEIQEREIIRKSEQRKKETRYMFAGVSLMLTVIILGLLYLLLRSRMKRMALENKNFQLISQNMKLEKENLERELELKNKELTTNVMYQIRKNELISEIAQKLLRFSHEVKKDSKDWILGIVKELEKTQEDSVWNEFEARFHQVHNEFFDKIQGMNPDLSLNERRICAFLRLNMTTKEIASITGQSQRSIEVARTRLRKKLNLTNSDTGLVEFLASI
jgi:hypothetical protein